MVLAFSESLLYKDVPLWSLFFGLVLVIGLAERDSMVGMEQSRGLVRRRALLHFFPLSTS
jgi:hypothetical protein